MADIGGGSVASFRLPFGASTVLRYLLLATLVLVVTGTIANIVIHHVAATPNDGLAKVMRRIDLGHEPSIPQWYSSGVMLAAAGILAVIGVTRAEANLRFQPHWYALAALFVVLSMDEAVQVHEMVDTALSRQLGTSGALHFAWVIPGFLLVAVVAASLIPFLAHLDHRTRWRLIASGAVFVTGALGFEMLEGVLMESGGEGALSFSFALAIEEGLEMVGMGLFLWALLEYLEEQPGTARVDLRTLKHAPQIAPTPSILTAQEDTP